MKTKVIEYGARMTGRVETVFRGVTVFTPAAVIIAGDDGEGYIIRGARHDVAPRQGQRVTMEFTPGGRFGGYWKIVGPAAEQARD